MSCRPAHLLALFTELFYVHVGLLWIIESRSGGCSMSKRADFRDYETHFCMLYLHVLLFIPEVSFFSYPQCGCVTHMFVCVGP